MVGVGVVIVLGSIFGLLARDPLRRLTGHHWCDRDLTDAMSGFGGFVSYRFHPNGAYLWSLHTDYFGAEHGTGRWRADRRNTITVAENNGTVTIVTLAMGRDPAVTVLRGAAVKGIHLFQCDGVPGD